MRTINRFRALIFCLGLSLALGLSVPGAWAQVSAANDAVIQTNVANALQQAPQLQGQQITAATIQGVVTLSGVVKNKATKQLAEKLVSSVNGVRSVQNNLTIGDPNAQADAPKISPPNGQNSVPPDVQSQNNQGQQSTDQQQQPPAPNAPPQPESPAPPPYAATTAQPGGYGHQPRPEYRPQRSGSYPPPPEQNAQNTSGPLTVPAGTLLRVRTSGPLDTKSLRPGAAFEVTAASDVYEHGAIAVPRGAALEGQVVEAKNAGPFGGSAKLQMKLTALNLAGRVYPVATEVWSNQGQNKSGYTATNTAGGAVLGALLGAALGGGTGAAFGAVAGGVTGATVSGATPGPRLVLPPETLLTFRLAAPVTVQPVSYEEAERLAASVPQPQPRLRPRPVYMAPPPYYYYGPAYYRYGW